MSSSKLLKTVPLLVTPLLMATPVLAQNEMKDDSAELPAVVVSATPLEQGLLEFGKPVSILEGEELAIRNRSTLGETLSLEPGVTSSFFGQGASRPIIRGFGGDRVRILRNGITSGDVSDVSEDHLVVADPLQATKVEVLRGPETLLYGSGAIGGAVNVADDSIAETALGKPFEGSVLSQLGNSADNERTFAAKVRAETGKINWFLSGFTRETDSYEIPGNSESDALIALEEAEEHGHEMEHEHEHGEDEHGEDEHGELTGNGKVDNSDTDTSGATFGASYVGDSGFLGISVSGFESDYGIAGHAHGEEEGEEHGHEDEEDELGHEHEGEEEDVRIDAEQLRIDIRGRADDVSDSIESIKFRMGLIDYEHDEIEGGGVATNYERDTIDTRVEVVHTEMAGFEGAVGGVFLFDDFSAVGEEAFLTPTKTFAPAVFLYEERPVNDALTFSLGARAEMVHHDPSGLDTRSFTPFSASIGSVWTPLPDEDLSVGLTLAYSERAPNTVELFSNGAHLARQIVEVGDSSLSEETSWGVDLAIQKASGVFTGAFTPFYRHFNNYINLADTGAEDEGLSVFAYEGVEATYWGLEIESAVHLDEVVDMGPHQVSLGHQIDYVRARDDDNNQDIPRTPPLRNIVRLNYGFQDTVSAGVEAVFVERQDDVGPLEIPTDSYTQLNSEVALRLPTFNKNNLSLFVRGTNLTDEEARVHSSFLKDLAPLRGRAFLFGVRGTF